MRVFGAIADGWSAPAPPTHPTRICGRPHWNEAAVVDPITDRERWQESDTDITQREFEQGRDGVFQIWRAGRLDGKALMVFAFQGGRDTLNRCLACTRRHLPTE
jgi:hypothetical protein